MSSGDICLEVLDEWPPESSSAIPFARDSANTVGVVFKGWSFESGSDKYMDYLCRVVNYASGGITIKTKWMSATVSGGSSVFELEYSIHKLELDDSGSDADGTLTFDTVDSGTDTPASASGEVAEFTITKVHANCDGMANGDFVILRQMRDVSVGSNMSGAAQVLGFTVTET